MGEASSDQSGFGLNGPEFQSASSKDADVGVHHLLVPHVQPLLIDVKGIRVLHDEFSGPHDAKARSDLIPKFGLDLVENERHLSIRSDLFSGDVRHDLLMGRPQAEVPIVSIFQPAQFLSIGLPAMALLPNLCGLDKGKQDLNGAGTVHLFANDRLDLSNGSKTQGKVGVDACCQFQDHARPKHQLMAWDIRLSRVLF